MKTASKIALILISTIVLACSSDDTKNDDINNQNLTSHTWYKNKVSINNVPVTLTFCETEDHYIFYTDGTSEYHVFFNAGNDTDCVQFDSGEYATYTYDESENRIHIIADDYEKMLVDVEITSSSLKFSLDNDDDGTFERREEYKN